MFFVETKQWSYYSVGDIASLFLYAVMKNHNVYFTTIGIQEFFLSLIPNVVWYNSENNKY